MTVLERVGAAQCVDVPQSYRVVALETETDDVVTLRVQPLDGRFVPFEPAQYGMIGLAGVGEVPVSISSAATDRSAHAYTLRRTGAVTNLLADCRPGDVVTVRGPFGRPWDLRRGATRHRLFVAGGIGLAPLRAAIEAAVEADDGARTSVLVGAVDDDSQIFAPWLDRLGERAEFVRRSVDRATPHDPEGLAHGFVTDLIAEAVGAAGVGPEDTAGFVCGPDAMMRAAIDALTAAGLRRRDIQVTLERNMQCANGWCGHCQLGPILVCRDGPVLDAVELGDVLERSEL